MTVGRKGGGFVISIPGEAPTGESSAAKDYSPERIAEFLLTNAVGAADYAAAEIEVRRLGLDPDQVPHRRPAGV